MTGIRGKNEKIEESKSLSLKANFSWVFMGNLIYAVSRGLMLMILAKLGTPEIVGEFSLSQAVIAPIFRATDLRLRTILATDAEEKYKFRDYFRLRYYTTLLAFAIVLILLFLGSYGVRIAGVIIFMTLGKVFEAISDILYGLFQSQERMDRIGRSVAIKSILSLVGMVVIFWMTRNIVAAAGGIALSYLLTLIFYDFYNARGYIFKGRRFDLGSLRPMAELFLPLGIILVFESLKRNMPEYLKIVEGFKMKYKPLKPLIILCLPMGAVLMLSNLNSNIPTYFVQGFLGSKELGYFSAILYIITGGDTIVSALAQTVTPRMAKYFSKGDSRGFFSILGKSILISLGLGGAGLLVIWFLGEPVLTLLYKPEYGEYWNVFLVLMIASCIQYMGVFISNAVTVARKFKIQPVIYLINLIFNAILNWVFVPRFGLMGSAVALIISYCIHLLGNLWVFFY